MAETLEMLGAPDDPGADPEYIRSGIEDIERMLGSEMIVGAVLTDIKADVPLPIDERGWWQKL